MAYFTRPGNSVILEPLDSPIIVEAASKAAPGQYNTGVTAQDWFERRIRNRRLANRKVCMSSAVDLLLLNPFAGP